MGGQAGGGVSQRKEGVGRASPERGEWRSVVVGEESKRVQAPKGKGSEQSQDGGGSEQGHWSWRS